MFPAPILAFAAATLALMLVPGPNVALIVANSLSFGVRAGLVTVAGTSAAMALQLAIVAAGLTALLGGLGHAFATLRWAGVAYLLWLGIRAWRAPADDLSPSQALPPRKAFARGFFVSLANPKTLAFYAAFLPQFLDPATPLGPQMAVLSGAFLAIAVGVDSGWALLASRARPAVARFGRARNQLIGAILIGAAGALALARR